MRKIYLLCYFLALFIVPALFYCVYCLNFWLIENGLLLNISSHVEVSSIEWTFLQIVLIPCLGFFLTAVARKIGSPYEKTRNQLELSNLDSV
ncbi:hypothetical protein pv_255 [Pithovirus sibericum]|uniref:Transmembrane protein n=1 Tax=Pithovirus sibericum TaxID=1450746 RepID=W5S665_9VIRU|nr:hypothetical protein pv_255 [Pithovirus sibericum]AHH01822.1 hypothetical protein pv_255 [Pithovirus sibericum]